MKEIEAEIVSRKKMIMNENKVGNKAKCEKPLM